jgi:hypothetical protein
MHTYIRTHMHTYVNTYIQTHTYTYIQARHGYAQRSLRSLERRKTSPTLRALLLSAARGARDIRIAQARDLYMSAYVARMQVCA